MSRLGCLHVLTLLDQPLHLVGGHLVAIILVEESIVGLMLAPIERHAARSTVVTTTLASQNGGVLPL